MHELLQCLTDEEKTEQADQMTRVFQLTTCRWQSLTNKQSLYTHCHSYWKPLRSCHRVSRRWRGLNRHWGRLVPWTALQIQSPPVSINKNADEHSQERNSTAEVQQVAELHRARTKTGKIRHKFTVTSSGTLWLLT